MIPIAHFEEKYFITNTGQIYSQLNNTFKKLSTNSNGYSVTTLKLNGKTQQVTSHRLVALHYLPNPYNHPIVNHIDGDKSNNNLVNLEWASAEENCQHALETKLRPGFLSMDNKRLYLNRVLAGELIKDIADEVNRGQEVLSKMLRTQATKDGKQDEWTRAMKVRRKEVAIRNLKTVNS